MTNLKRWDCFLGSVTGFLFAKVYQIWAILYWMEGVVISGKDGYWGTEIWVFAIENPNLFLFIVVALFATAGNLIQKKYFRQNEKGDTKPEPYKKNEIPTE